MEAPAPGLTKTVPKENSMAKANDSTPAPANEAASPETRKSVRELASKAEEAWSDVQNTWALCKLAIGNLLDGLGQTDGEVTILSLKPSDEAAMHGAELAMKATMEAADAAIYALIEGA